MTRDLQHGFREGAVVAQVSHADVVQVVAALERFEGALQQRLDLRAVHLIRQRRPIGQPLERLSGIR